MAVETFKVPAEMVEAIIRGAAGANKGPGLNWADLLLIARMVERRLGDAYGLPVVR